MRFQTDLVRAELIRRYKRFLADVRLEDGREVTAHCPNPGAMTGLADPGATVWLEPNDDPKKKLKYGWRLTEIAERHLACIDTSRANAVVGEALRAGEIPALAPYKTIKPEVRYGENSRVDFLLSDDEGAECFVEVKSVTLSRERDLAEFPDTVTKRGARHMADLAKVAKGGARAVIFYLVQRDDCGRVTLASDVDPAYAEAVGLALAAGVEVIAYRAAITRTGITLGPELTFDDHAFGRAFRSVSD